MTKSSCFVQKNPVQPIQLEVKDKIVNKQNIKNPFSYQLEFTGIYNISVRSKIDCTTKN